MSRGIIVLDPGHGKGSNVSPAIPSYSEGTSMFTLAMKLKAVLEKNNFTVLVTRNAVTDNPSLSARGQLAGKNKALLFVSLHSNAVGSNKNDSVRGVDIFYSLTNPSWNKKFSEELGVAIAKCMGNNFRGAHIKQYPNNPNADYYGVIRAAAQSGCTKAILIEHGFHTSTADTQWLMQDSNLQKLADLECAHILKYFADVSGNDVIVTPTPSKGEVKEGSTVTINSGAKYGGLSDSRGKTVPSTQLAPKEHTVKDIAIHNGVEEALLKEIVSWVPTSYLSVVGAVVPAPTSGWYRVRTSWDNADSQKGAFKDLANAKACVDENGGNYKVFDDNGNILYPEQKKNEWYRVRITWDNADSQKGAFKDLVNAKACADENAAQQYKVFDDNGKAVYIPELPKKEEAPKVEDPSVPEKTPVIIDEAYNIAILGKPEASLEQMIAFVKQHNPNYAKGEEVATAFYNLGMQYGIRGDIALCQSCHETGYFTFKGDVKPEQNNFAGIGATGGGVPGNSFATVAEGVAAQLQHLWAYTTKEDLPAGWVLVDPRFKYVTANRGACPTWIELSGKWAVPGYSGYKSLEDAILAKDTYGHKIINIYNKLLQVTVTTEKKSIHYSDIPAGHWSIDAFDRATELGIFTPISEGIAGFTEELARTVQMLLNTVDYLQAS